MSTRGQARHVRQRKLNTKQPLRIIRENEIEDAIDDESQRHIPQVETGVEKNEEVEYHLQAAINAANAAALGAKSKASSYIPTPEVRKAKGIKYDELYPKVFSQPATYIRFSSTVEDCVGIPYCMNEDDEKFLKQLNDGKDVNGHALKDKTVQCSDDAFEEVMNFFEETSQKLQPFATVESSVPILSLQELEQAREEDLSAEAQHVAKPIYQYWVSKKGGRPLLPTIKVRLLDTSLDADDADPYVCFRRREVRQTRKTRGRDAQVVEKLKKLRIELEQARQLVQMVRDREKLNDTNLSVTRKVFEQRKQLKEVKIAKNLVGGKGEDEELLVNQKPVAKPKGRGDGSRPGPTIRLRSLGDGRSAPDNDLVSLADLQAQAEDHVDRTIESRKDQHRRWNKDWQDRTWDPITPPPEPADQTPKWASLPVFGTSYPTPPPSLPSRSSQDRDGDVDMSEQKPMLLQDAVAGAEPTFNMFVPPPWHESLVDHGEPDAKRIKLDIAPACRLRYGRGGRLHLEMRKQKPLGVLSRGVVSDSDSDDDETDFFDVPGPKAFDYRSMLNSRARSGPEGVERRQFPSGDQTAMIAAAQQQAPAAPSGNASSPPRLVTAGSSGG
ncbi:hypothetical protein DOTSEDRAFT_72667 [Dothistroma septosporum NZE10]|uniref:Enhancer of polycomb-like protein n=1 Tax=Dothistroma septosporum (strain NZE10 / CBS 128990) TaxID=675120 RepID=M2WMT5_DOTSN|nr:hypothetical protein DOTSEDRAFT_72667 [Dothistroma septosporum NZE10]